MGLVGGLLIGSGIGVSLIMLYLIMYSMSNLWTMEKFIPKFITSLSVSVLMIGFGALLVYIN